MYIDFLVLSFENRTDRIVRKGYHLPKVEIRDYNVITDGRNFLDQPIKSDLKTYNNIRQIAASQGDYYITASLIDYPYFKEHCKLIAIDLRRYDTIKTCQWNFFKFCLKIIRKLFIIGKYVKMRFKNRSSPCYFLSSGGQKIKLITTMEQKVLLFFTILVSFLIAFLPQKLIYTINIWLNFVFGSFFEQDHLLNLII